MTSLDPIAIKISPSTAIDPCVLDKRGCRILRLGGVQEGAGCDGVSAVGKREKGRAHATNWVARKPTQRLRLLTRATHRRHRIISPLDLFTSKRQCLFVGGVFSLCIALPPAVSACLPAHRASLLTALPLACSSALQGYYSSVSFSSRRRFAFQEGDEHKYTIGVTERERPSFKFDDSQTSQLRRGHSSSSHSVAHFPPTEAPSPARPSRSFPSIHPFFLNQTSHTS